MAEARSYEDVFTQMNNASLANEVIVGPDEGYDAFIETEATKANVKNSLVGNKAILDPLVYACTRDRL